jgi:uridine phosphorylase
MRIGTAMAVPPAKLGDFVLADGALRAEGTSNTYAPLGFPAIADFELNTKLRERLGRSPTCGNRTHQRHGDREQHARSKDLGHGGILM